MADFKIIYYIVLIMFALLTAVFVWGWVTYARTKTSIKFFNTPLVVLTSVVAVIGLILTFVPIFMKVWEYSSDAVKADAGFITLLVLEFVFLVAFLVLAYVFAFDFGIALDKENNKLQFFGQTINTNKIIELQERKHTVKMVYEQGFKNLKKKVIIISPKAKAFVKEILPAIITVNQQNKAKTGHDQQLEQMNKPKDHKPGDKDNHKANITINETSNE